ncbi:tetratricopeptide repeat protein [Comamonas sp. JC664]|uniref:tetratricopeptide repeat protein n=1 Tax=Comamonas sp. JC664 TaxID=2801917 RepID=UPI001748E5F6|nr:tetratricopeptide repeat protein [Comamonas sp. JC664]GHG93720.1 hypothetical protein GCM10012319_56300 [Comamonas sp. KCTC 72670]
MSPGPRRPRARVLTSAVLTSGLWLSACATTAPRPDTAAAEAPATVSTEEAAKPEVIEPAPVARPADPRGAEQDFAHAVEIARRGELTAAEAALRTLVELDPKLDYAWTNLGIVQERLGKPAEAERSYRKALEAAPEQQSAWDCLTRLYGRTGRAAKLEAELRERLTSQPDSVTLRTALAITLLQTKDLAAAAAEAKLALKGDERHVRAMQVLAQVYYREGKHELARMVLENARAIDAKDGATHNALGLVYLALDSRPQAMEAFKEASLLRPDFAEARNNFGAMLNEAQDYAAAVTELEAAVRAAPDFASARLNLGNAYRGVGDFARARAEYEQVLLLMPTAADAYFNLAILYLDVEPPGMETLKRYKTALSHFDSYQARGGRDERIAQYVKDARKLIDREERRLEREQKDQLRKAAEAQKAAAAAPPEGTPPAPEVSKPELDTRVAAPDASPSTTSDPAAPPSDAPDAPVPAGSDRLTTDAQ